MTNVLSGRYAGIPLLSKILAVALPFLGCPAWGADDGSVLPFPPAPTASVAGATLQESKHQRRVEPSRLRPDAPNILIILLDDVGFGLADTYGGDVHTPTLSRIAASGISFNAFHTTAICSPTRAALLTGRNHHRVGTGTIAERAVDWDGYTGVIPKTSATIAQTLRYYGYDTAAFGKWHNTPATETTAMGPFDRWPTGYGFDHFYGFMGGETSQWEPRLYENTTPVEAPRDENYHLSADLADKAVIWLRQHRSYAPDKPFLVYWAPGAGHGPHHIFKERADKYRGKFDDGWDAMRERVFARQNDIGWIPADTKLTPRAVSMPAWDSIPEAERPFQRRLMEVFAGFVEHVDVQAGKLIDELEATGQRDNTIVLYLFGDNGSSAEGQGGSISELLAQNQIPNTIVQQLEALDGIGGLDALGSAKTDNMYHAGWGWAGNTPFHHTKLVASHFGGTRNPLAVSWPKGINPDKRPRQQFHHVTDIMPTLYDVLGITPPKAVDGFVQDPIDGVSMAYSFGDASAVGQKSTQYFENNGSRGIFRDGWYAATFGPLTPWLTVNPGLATWDSRNDPWELYDLSKDFSQADDLAAAQPGRLERMKEVFLEQARENQAFPIGAGIWLRIHPEDRLKSPYRSWAFDATTTRMPEFAAPGLGREGSHVTIEAEFGPNASGVLYALGGAGGGLTLFMDEGHLIYEYNMMLIERYSARSEATLSPGRHLIEIDTAFASARPLSQATVTLTADGTEMARTTVKRTVPAAFSATETFDIGADLGSPVSLAYFDRRPFRFDGTIRRVDVTMK